jgi:transposase
MLDEHLPSTPLRMVASGRAGASESAAQLGQEPNASLASITKEGGMGPCLTVEGATIKEVIESYIEEVLAPMLHDGQVVVMDNLSSHKAERVKELIEGRRCGLIYLLPPYSPAFNLTTIEQAFSKITNLLREARALGSRRR